MSVARFIADQRTLHRVPHTVTCALLGVSLSWFYKWVARASGPGAVTGLHTTRDRRRDAMDRAVRVAFGKARGLHGSRGCCMTCVMTGGGSVRRPWRTRCAARGWWHAGSGVVAD